MPHPSVYFSSQGENARELHPRQRMKYVKPCKDAGGVILEEDASADDEESEGGEATHVVPPPLPEMLRFALA